jgi:hypothetical protein
LDPSSQVHLYVERGWHQGHAETYDGIGRLTSETYTNAADANANYTDAYTFDLAGNRLTLTHTQSTPLNLDYTETSTYDANDRLLTVLHDASNDDNDTSTIYGYGDPWFAGDDSSLHHADRVTGFTRVVGRRSPSIESTLVRHSAPPRRRRIRCSADGHTIPQATA